jgi:hypothetical protein
MATATLRPAGRLALLAAAAAALAGCASQAKAPAVATVGTTTTSSAADSTSANTTASGAPSGLTQLQQQALAYAECMRANGVPRFPDPSGSGGFQFSPGSGVDPSSPAFQAAQAKCRKLLPAGPTPGSTTHPSATWLARMVKAAQCMRRHGIAGFPDPVTTVPAKLPVNGLISDIQGAIFVFPDSLDTQTALFVRAANACGFPLHNH